MPIHLVYPRSVKPGSQYADLSVDIAIDILRQEVE